MRQLLCFLFVIPLLVSCKPSVPDEYIQPGEMEDILYDYHIAIAMADIPDADGSSTSSYEVRQSAYKMAVLKKYGVTEKQFENSMRYYTRNMERMYDIYENISERLERESSAMGAGMGDGGYKHVFAANSDTSEVWKGDRNLLLMADAPYNKYSFSIKVDTTFHKGDRLQLAFNAQYIVQEGSRDAVVVMCVKFANDSIATVSQRATGNSRHTVTVTDSKRDGIKEIRGYMLFSRGLSSPSSTLKLLFVRDIQFLKIHTREQSAPDGQSKDSVKLQTESAPSPANAPMGAPNMPMRQMGSVPAGVRQTEPVPTGVRQTR